MYFPCKLLVLVVLWRTWQDSNCMISNQDQGLDDIKAVFGEEENEFKAFLNWVDRAQICLRRGETADRACYMLYDFMRTGADALDMKELRNVAQWKNHPYPNQDMCKRWYKRLWNSIAFILRSDEEASVARSPILLAVAASSGRETYRASQDGIGDRLTFSKGAVGEKKGVKEEDKSSKEESKEEENSSEKGEKIGDIKRLNVDESLADLSGTVKSVMEWMNSNKT